ncbi:MAG: hypothetical protein F6K47_21075 [Symploca sp. SIO2E6]|nr:hypothetical protein [Symploca sp. SIO2E6]
MPTERGGRSHSTNNSYHVRLIADEKNFSASPRPRVWSVNLNDKCSTRHDITFAQAGTVSYNKGL